MKAEEAQALEPLVKLALVLDKRVVENGLPGLSVLSTIPGESPRKKTIGPFMSEADRDKVLELLEKHKVWEDFEKVVHIWDIQNLKNPFPDLSTPGLNWITLLANKTWTALFRILQTAGALKQHDMFCGDYLSKVIDHHQRNRDEATRKEKRFNYIVCEPGLPFNAYQLVSDVLNLPLLSPPEAPQALVLYQPEEVESSTQEQSLVVQNNTEEAIYLDETEQELLSQLNPEQREKMLRILESRAQQVATVNSGETGVTKSGSYSTADALMEDKEAAARVFVKGALIQHMRPGEEEEKMVSDVDEFKPESNFLEYFIESIDYTISEYGIKRYTTIVNFLVMYFKLKNKLKYKNGKPFISFITIGREGVLEEMKTWMVEQGYSLRTINTYLGLIRTALGKAGAIGRITAKFNPFDRYAPNRVKLTRPPQLEKALEMEILRMFFAYEASTELSPTGWSEAKAKAFWIISFLCFGANIADVLRFLKVQIQGKVVQFTRSKRDRSTGKVLITVPIDPALRELFEQWQQDVNNKSPYVFEGLELTKEETDYLHQLQADPKRKLTLKQVRDKALHHIQAKKVKNFVQRMNEFLEKIRVNMEKQFKIKIPRKITSVTTRHSVVLEAKKRNISPLIISHDMLGHESLHSLGNYIFSDTDAEKLQLKLDITRDMYKGVQVETVVPDKQEDETPEASQTPASVILQEMAKAS